MSTEEPQVRRRTFCKGLVLTGTGLMIAAKMTNAESRENSPQVAFPPMKIDGAEKLIPGSWLYFNYPAANDPAVLIRSREDQYFAFSRKCAHMACSVNFDQASQCLQCPCHKGAYDPQTGSVLHGPPLKPLDMIVLQIRAGGEVWAAGKRFARRGESTA